MGRKTREAHSVLGQMQEGVPKGESPGDQHLPWMYMAFPSNKGCASHLGLRLLSLGVLL